MAELPYIGTINAPSLIVTEPKPLDVRIVVNSVDNLTDRSIPNLYTGIVVNVKGTGDLYVLTTAPRLSNQAASWVKVGGNEVNPEDNLAYYEEKLGAKVVDSFTELTSADLGSSFVGMFGVVKSSDSDSDEDAGLYVLTRVPNTTATNWYKILGGAGGSASSGLDVVDVVTSDGSVPSSGSGFSISGNDKDALVEETYVDNGFEPNQYYTSRGLNSSDSNGTGNLGDVEYITLSNGGESYIKLNSADDDNWIEINIADDSLGLSMSDITYLDEDGNVHTMESSPLVLPKETPVSFGENGFDFAGLTETRGDDPTEYVFGEDGSTYEDVDIYSSKALPTVYAYSDGNPVRVLTEGDKVEIINMVESSAVDRISDEEILGIF